MKSVFAAIGKMVSLWIILILAQGIGGLLFFRHPPVFQNDGPLSAAQAMLVVCAMDALITGILAWTLEGSRWQRGAICAVMLFGCQSAQSLIEAVVFASDVRLPTDLLVSSAEIGLFRAVVAGIAVGALWPRPAGAAHRWIDGLAWKLPLVALVYVGCYFAGGALIAWPVAAVRAYYAHVEPGSQRLLALIQFGRGLIWAFLALLLLRNTALSTARAALVTGVALSGFMVPQLLYPNPFMPWSVRSAHLMEVGLSNLVFGFLAALIILRRQATDIDPHGQIPMAA